MLYTMNLTDDVDNYSMIDVDKLTKLTSIEIEPEVLEKFKDSVSSILKWCAVLNKVDTTGITPIFSIFDVAGQGLQNLNDDKVTEGGYQQDILKNCADKEDVFICVPKVIE